MKILWHGLLTLIALLQVACGDSTNAVTGNQLSPASCRGIFYLTDSQGRLSKWDQYWQAGQGVCLTDKLSLSNWEQSLQNWTLNKTACKPQSQVQSQSLVASGNFYTYRDNRILLDLNATTGVYRRLVLAQGRDGSMLFTRLQGCFYVRTDSVNGSQLLLDTVPAASSDDFDPVEIFSYSNTGVGLSLVRYDDVGDWSAAFCPVDTVQVGFCDLLRNGNLVDEPVLTAAQSTAMLNDAILIRKTYIFASITAAAFESQWSNVATNAAESERNDFEYTIIPDVDTPLYISDSWKAYVMGGANPMPDVSHTFMLPNICYQGFQTSPNRSAFTNGKVCFVNGQYQFAPQ